MVFRLIRVLLVQVVLLCGANVSAAADIVVGQVAPFSDATGTAKDLRIGLAAYFDAVNSAGGVHGNMIRFVTKDRGLKAADAVVKVREVLEESNPLLFAGLLGTGPMEALVKSGVLAQAGIPVVGIRTGAVSLHEPVNPFLFHTRPNYLGEVQKIVTQLAAIGLNRVAVFYENTAFGAEGLNLVKRTMQQEPAMQLIHTATYEQSTTKVEQAVSTILSAAPQSIIAIANSPATAEFYKTYRAKGGRAQVVALSVTDVSEVVKRIKKEYARGLIVTQVMPDPGNNTTPIIRELKANMKTFGPPGLEINQTMVEGYLTAKTVVEALKRAGPNPTRKKVLAALESMKQFDAGGVIIGFTPANHTGSKFVELAIVLASGKLMR